MHWEPLAFIGFVVLWLLFVILLDITLMDPRSAAQTLLALAGRGITGNIDLANRPVTRNADGTISTVRSMSIGTDQGETLIPTIAPNGWPMSPQQAINLFRQTGQNLGTFRSPADATAYAKALHDYQAKMYGR